MNKTPNFNKRILSLFNLCLFQPLFLLGAFVLLSSCSETLEQYQPASSHPASSRTPADDTFTLASRDGLNDFLDDDVITAYVVSHELLEQELSEEEKDEKTRANSLIPIDYSTGGVAGINITMEYEEAGDILNPDYVSRGRHLYKEGILVVWREDPPRTPHVIIIGSTYQGSIDFGPGIGKRKVGDNFTEFFSSGVQDIQKDEKAIQLAVSLYKHFEDPDEENCLTSQKCALNINPEGNYIIITLPKMVLLFGNNERFQLVQVALKKNDNPGCFASPLDLLSGQFFCGGTKNGPTLSLGENYNSALEKSGIDPDLPIIYANTAIIQLIHTGGIGWQRNNYDEESETVPEDSHLSGVRMNNNYILPFLIGNSLIKISIGTNNQVQLSLDPLSENEGVWSMADIMRKTSEIKKSSDFYFATRMPQIKGNYMLQRNLIKALLNLLEENLTQESFKIYKIFYGEYDDKYVLAPKGVLQVISLEGYPLEIFLEINSESGDTTIQISLTDDDFSLYTLKNQSPLSLTPEATNLGGFQLGDFIYLRNKDTGANTAIAAYCTADNTLTELAEYNDEAEYGVVYESGRDRNITYQKSEIISVEGTDFYIHPTGQTKEINGQIFESYEINSIALGRKYFSKEIEGLCDITDFNTPLGIYDEDFVEDLNDQISQAKDSPTWDGCPYISPQDPLFSGVKRAWFFPRHKLILSASDRELFALRIYKNPSNTATLAQENNTRRQCP